MLCVTAALIFALPALSAERPAGCRKADRILILKKERTLQLLCAGKVIRTYKVALGTQPVGRKEKQGDHKTPEGNYKVQAKIRNSHFHRALLISYPNSEDRERAKKLGVSPGGAIEIHGLPDNFAWVGSNQRLMDWTDGCIAVTNPEIEEIWKLVPLNTPVEIRAK